MYSCLKVKKTLNVNLNFLCVKFLRKCLTQNVVSLTTFLGQITPNTLICDQGICVKHSQVHILKSRIKESQTAHCYELSMSTLQ